MILMIYEYECSHFKTPCQLQFYLWTLLVEGGLGVPGSCPDRAGMCF